MRGKDCMVKTLSGGIAAAIALAAGMITTLTAQRNATPPIPNLAGKVMTVAGPIDPSALGQTLSHEHIFIDFKAPPPMVPPATGIGVLQPPGTKGAGLTDFDESLAEIQEFQKAGGRTIVDVTDFGLTRDPEALLRVSKASGLNVVMGAGWYQKALHPPDMAERTVEELTAIVVRDVTVGAQGTSIRSGIIGEVGVNGKPLEPNELKSVRASARAARITGAPITIHSFATSDEMMRVLDIIASEGVDLSRVVMGHTGGKDMEYLKRLFQRGVFVEWDYMGQAPLPPAADAQRIASIAAAINAGYSDHVLLAHDVCTKAQLKRNGGGGYTYISDVILPGLKAKGISDETIRKIMVDNPRRMLTFVAPQLAVTEPRP
jgi:phosphotriesterase-related protein